MILWNQQLSRVGCRQNIQSKEFTRKILSLNSLEEKWWGWVFSPPQDSKLSGYFVTQGENDIGLEIKGLRRIEKKKGLTRFGGTRRCSGMSNQHSAASIQPIESRCGWSAAPTGLAV